MKDESRVFCFILHPSSFILSRTASGCDRGRPRQSRWAAAAARPGDPGNAGRWPADLPAGEATGAGCEKSPLDSLIGSSRRALRPDYEPCRSRAASPRRPDRRAGSSRPRSSRAPREFASLSRGRSRTALAPVHSTEWQRWNRNQRSRFRTSRFGTGQKSSTSLACLLRLR